MEGKERTQGQEQSKNGAFLRSFFDGATPFVSALDNWFPEYALVSYK